MKLNRLFILAAFILIFLVAGASAQSADWKGFYIGGNVGGSLGRSDASTKAVFSSTLPNYFATTSPPAINALSPQHLEPDGFVGGGQIGYNFQNGNWVFGLEADIQATTGSDSVSSSGVYPCCPPTGFTVTQRIEHNWFFTARPRVGYAKGKALIYVTGGVAVTNLNYQAVFTDTFAAAHENGGRDEAVVGFTVGGGLEYQVSRHWSFKGEYLYADFGQVASSSTNLTSLVPPLAFPNNTFFHDADLRAHIVRFGINFRF